MAGKPRRTEGSAAWRARLAQMPDDEIWDIFCRLWEPGSAAKESARQMAERGYQQHYPEWVESFLMQAWNPDQGDMFFTQWAPGSSAAESFRQMAARAQAGYEHGCRGYQQDCRLWAESFLMQAWDADQIRCIRWYFVCDGLDRPGRYQAIGWKLPLEDAYQYASTELEGSPAEGVAATMRKDYDEMQSRLMPSGRHRPRSYKPRQPSSDKKTAKRG